jgi:hypothetical protein
MEGDPVVLIDNVERPLQGDWLCSIITSETFSQRVLGRTEMAKVLTTTLILATGNNLVIAGDLRTRALLCCLDPKTERPDQQEFKVDLREFLHLHRPELVAAGLTIMRAYQMSGERAKLRDDSIASVDWKPLPAWGRFERWSHMVREPLVWLGYPDPCDSLKTIERDDPERNTHLRFLDAWFKEFKTKGVTSREAVDQADREMKAGIDPGPLTEIIRELALDRAGSLNVKRLSAWLSRHVGRIAAGMKLTKSGSDDHSVVWKVETVGQGGSPMA